MISVGLIKLKVINESDLTMQNVVKQVTQSVCSIVIHINRHLFFDKQPNNSKGNQIFNNYSVLYWTVRYLNTSIDFAF